MPVWPRARPEAEEQPCRTPWSNHDDKGAGLDHGCRLIHYYNGTTEPPQNWELWYDLVRAFGENVVARYGLDVVATWRFEVYVPPTCLCRYGDYTTAVRILN